MSSTLQDDAPLLSDQWFRVADLRPRLARGLVLDRVAYRGEVWMVCTPADGRQRVRLNGSAWAFVGRFDGQRTVRQLWDIVLAERQDDAPTQDECIALLLQMVRAGLIAFDGMAGEWPDFGLLAQRQAELAATPRPAADSDLGRNSWLAWRFTVGNPDAMLGRLARRLRPLLGPATVPLWAAWVALGLGAAVWNAGELAAYYGQWSAAPAIVALTALLLLPMKALHETAHGLVLKHLGGSVPRWGVTLLVLFPAPWVDAGSADSLTSPRQRLAVSAAGAMAELAVACAGVWIGLMAQPGWLRDLGFGLFAAGALSSLLINANPLLRFDGYYALTDWLELPNLAQRSQRWWFGALQKRLGLPASARAALPPPAPGELTWWRVYAPASLAMRCVLAVTITVWLTHLAWPLGLAAALTFATTLVIKPLAQGLRALAGTTAPAPQLARARWRVAAAVVAVLVLGGTVPLPHGTVTQGVVWLPEDAALRPPHAGLVLQPLVPDGQWVRAGDPLLVLQDDGLAVRRSRLQRELVQLQTERVAALADDSARAQRLGREWESKQAELARLAELEQLQTLNAPHEGLLRWQGRTDWQGRHVAAGTWLGTVVPAALVPEALRPAGLAPATAPSPEPGPSGAPAGAPSPLGWRLRLALEPPDAAQIAQHLAQGSLRTQVRLASAPGQPLAGVPGRDFTAVQRLLPSPALADIAGGPWRSDPSNPSGLTPATGLVWLDIEISPGAAGVQAWPGQRGWVRFDHPPQPLFRTWAERLHRVLLPLRATGLWAAAAPHPPAGRGG